MTLGSPQGGSLSPVLFTCYLAAALVVVRQKTTRPNPPISTRGMPLEWEDSDDVDFAGEEWKPLDAVLSTACIELVNWNLFINKAKTDNVHIFLVNTSEKDDAGNMLRGNEKWQSSETLESLLCSTKDVQTRCILGNVAFWSFWKMWMRRPKIPLNKRMLVYNAIIIRYAVQLQQVGSNNYSTLQARCLPQKLPAIDIGHVLA